jgi:hypothetical protein
LFLNCSLCKCCWYALLHTNNGGAKVEQPNTAELLSIFEIPKGANKTTNGKSSETMLRPTYYQQPGVFNKDISLKTNWEE